MINHPDITIRVNVGWLSDKGKKMLIKCENKEDIKQYYSTLRARLSPLGIPLKAWSDIQPNQSLCELTATNCLNYKNVIQQIRLALYTFLDDNKDQHFNTFYLPHGYIDAYSHNTDGLMVLYQIVQLIHQRLIDPINGDEEPTKPIFIDNQNIFQFTRKLKEYFEILYSDVNRPADHNRKVLKYVRDQLNTGTNTDLFKKARNYITSELENLYKTKGGVKEIPFNLTLEGNIGITLMQQYSQDQQTEILNISRSQTPTLTAATINKFTQKPRFSKNKDRPATTRIPIDKICEACGQPGHCITVNGCDEVAKQQKLRDYHHNNKNTNKDKVKAAIDLYNKHQQNRLNNKRKFATARNTMRKEIKTMIDNDNINSPYQVAEIKQAFIEIYKDEYEPDCEDNIFNDLNEIDSVSDYSCDEKTQRMEDTSSQGSAE